MSAQILHGILFTPDEEPNKTLLFFPAINMYMSTYKNVSTPYYDIQ